MIEVGDFYKRRSERYKVVKITNISHSHVFYEGVCGFNSELFLVLDRITFATCYKKIKGYGTPLWRSINGY